MEAHDTFKKALGKYRLELKGWKVHNLAIMERLHNRIIQGLGWSINSRTHKQYRLH